MVVRAITALLGILLLYGTWSFFSVMGLVFLASLVTLFASHEYSRMIESTSKMRQLAFVATVFALHIMMSFISPSLMAFTLFFVLLSSSLIMFDPSSSEQRTARISSWTMGAIYCGILTSVVNIGIQDFEITYFIALLLVSFGTDTLAYLGGKLVGRHPLAPLISPNKTWEGSLIGLVGGSLLATFYLVQLETDSPWYLTLIFCIAGSLSSQIGDLFESMLKRQSGVKDSGRLMPGHGGLLDRIDGVLFAAPIIYIWMDFYLHST